MIVQADAKEMLDMDIAKHALETLTAHYPGHPWLARCDGGVLFIKNALLEGWKFGGACGYAIRLDNATDAKVLKTKIVRGGGELLERANRRRGRWEEGMGVTTMEGVVA